MAWFSRAPERKENPVGAAVFVNSPVPWGGWKERRSYVREGYQQNVIVYRAIREITQAAKAIKFELHQGDKVITDHPVLDLLARPTPTLSWRMWLEEMLTNRMIFGEMWCSGVPDAEYAELWPLSPADMQVHPGTGGIATAYQHNVGRNPVMFAVDPMTGESDVFFSKLYNPDDYWRGQSPLMAAALAADTHNNGLKWNFSLLKNFARPSGLISFKGAGPTGEALQRLREWAQQALTGPSNAGRIAIMGEGTFHEVGENAKDMDHNTTMQEMSKYVASALGVPLPLVTNDAATFNNMEQAKERLYTDTVPPILGQFLEQFGGWLLPNFGLEGAELKADEDSILALEDARDRKFKRATSGYTTGVLTLQESRELMGYQPEPEGDLRPVSSPEVSEEAEEEKQLMKRLAYGG